MSSTENRPVALVILDGWGVSRHARGNAVSIAHTPNYDEICNQYPMTTLAAAGPRVGQSIDAVGNPEIGHLSIGTGRPARSESFRIEDAIRDGSFFENEVLVHSMAQAVANGRSLHLIGLLSDAGVHSSTENLFALLRMARNYGLKNVYVHCILDGVDVPPRTADIYAEALEIKLADIGVGTVASLCGRYFAMDSGGNWERTARAYTMLAHGEGERSSDAIGSIRNSFLRGISDEFTAPIIIESAPDVPVTTIRDGDSVIFFNHRPESMRQLVRSLALPDSSGSVKPNLNTVCLVEYDRDFRLPVAFQSDAAENTLMNVLAGVGIKSAKITQTERFPHVTYFFNGGVDEESTLEQHVLLVTPKADTPDQQPEGQSFKITDAFMQSLESSAGGVYVINIPAAGLAAETGNLSKTIEAVQFVDTCIGGIVDHVRAAGGTVLITSTHGNCEEMLDDASGEPNAANTANHVPLHLVADGLNGTRLRDGGSLIDIAPTILGILGIETPPEMSGNDLRVG